MCKVEIAEIEICYGEYWVDGKCKACGSDVVEGVNLTDQKGDYMNACENHKCKNHKWHAVYSGDYLDYYDHV